MDRELLYRRALGLREPFAVEVSWIYLDGGTLDLGLVRDSTLTSANDFQIFGENFDFYCQGRITSGDSA